MDLMRQLRVTAYCLIAVLNAAILGSSSDVQAARATLPDQEIRDRENVFEWSPLVRDIQVYLIEFDLLSGSADGRISGDLKQAIRSYQRQHGLNEDGDVSRELFRHIEGVGRPDALKNRLAEARRKQSAKARNALLANPETRDLLDDPVPAATPQNQASLDECIQAPATECLIDEAMRSTTLIVQSNYRDWALREIVRAQARAGMVLQLRSNIRRISDVRLVIVSLREAVIGLVDAGRLTDAMALSESIPDDWNQARALAAVTIAESATDVDGAALSSLRAILPRLEDKVAASEIAAQVATSLAERNQLEVAIEILDQIRRSAAESPDIDTRQTLLAIAAGAYARIGRTETALNILRTLGDIGRDHIALAEAAEQIAAQGLSMEALALADRIRAPRLHVLALTKIASAQLQLGNTQATRKTLEQATNASLDILRPVAADSAVAGIAEAWARLSDHSAADAMIEKIGSPALQAQTRWQIAARTDGNVVALTAKAFAATNVIESAFDRASVLIRASTQMAKQGKTDDAQALFTAALRESRAIQSDWWRARIFSRLASARLEF